MRGVPNLYQSVTTRNSDYIPQFVGSIVPELQNFTATMKNRYDEASNEEDALMEALSNLSHLDTEEDTQYANELKEYHYNNILDRSKRGDYENLGRRVRRSAQEFVRDYSVLNARRQAFQEIQQRVMDDPDIHSPEKKARIIDKIRHMNRAPVDENGEFQRDESGKIILRGISDWAYAKDITPYEKVMKSLEKIKADFIQSGYVPDGQGLLHSQTREYITPQRVYDLAMKAMEADPEVVAYMETEAELATYNLEGEDLAMSAQMRNLSPYEMYKNAGYSAEEIEKLALQQATTVEELKIKPLDRIAPVYEGRGLGQDRMFRDFLKNDFKNNLKKENAEIAAGILQVDRNKLEARSDGVYLANLRHALRMKADVAKHKLETSGNIITTFAEDMKDVKYSDLTRDYREAEKSYLEGRSAMIAQMATLTGEALPHEDREEYKNVEDRYSSILNNPQEFQNFINNLSGDNRSAAESIYENYRSMRATFERAASNMKTIPTELLESVGDSAYKDYLRGADNINLPKSERVSRQDFDKLMDKYAKDPDRKLFKKRSKKEAFEELTFNRYSDAIDRSLITNAGVRVRDIGVFEHSGRGYIKDEETKVRSSATMTPTLFLDKDGTDLKTFIMDNKGSGNDKKEFTDLLNTQSLLKISTDIEPGGGRASVIVTAPNGESKRFYADPRVLNPARIDEMTAVMLQDVPNFLTSTGTHAAFRSLTNRAAESVYRYTEPVVIENLGNGVTQRINDMYTVKARKVGLHTVYDLFTNDGQIVEVPSNDGQSMKPVKGISFEDLNSMLGIQSISSKLIE